MARHVWREWIFAQRLPHGLCATASYTSRQLAVTNRFSTRHVQQRHIHPTLKLRYSLRLSHRAAYLFHIIHNVTITFLTQTPFSYTIP